MVELCHRGYDVTAVELVKHNLEILRSKHENIKTWQGDARNLHFLEDETFDITLLFGPLYHIHGKETKLAAISEAKRITKKGGIILIAYVMDFEEHQNTIAALYSGSVNQDVFAMKARRYNSCLEKALYGNKVPVSVYHNLIDCIHKNLDTLHEYYTLRKKALGLDELRHYDVYVPLVKSVDTHTTYEESVEICRNAQCNFAAYTAPCRFDSSGL